MKHRIPTLVHSLRFKFIASVVAIEVVMLSLLVWNNILIIQSTHTDRLNDTADSMVQQIANTSGSYMVAVDYASLRDYLHNVLKHRELSYLVVLDRDNLPVVSLGNMPETQWPEVDSHPSQVTDGVYDEARNIFVAGQPMGRVLMGFSLALMKDAINKSRFRRIAIAATEIFLTVIATVIIGIHLTRRLGILSNAAEEVGVGNYSVVVPTGANDEVGKTTAALNKMVTDVSRRTEQLEEAEAEALRLLAENRQLVHASLDIQEQERKRLARELHHELGRCITAIQADAESIRDLSRGCDNRIEASSAAIMQVSSRIYDVVHSMMQRLRPGILDDLGLIEALQEETRIWQERHPDTLCTFTASGLPGDLGERTNITIYRIVQECLTNVTRHAAATQVRIDLSRSADTIVLKVSDDGAGMDQIETTRGLGLIGMRERIESLGGQFLLDTAPDKGLSVTATIPVTARDAKQ